MVNLTTTNSLYSKEVRINDNAPFVIEPQIGCTKQKRIKELICGDLNM